MFFYNTGFKWTVVGMACGLTLGDNECVQNVGGEICTITPTLRTENYVEV